VDVFYGAQLLEVVVEDRKSPQLRMLVGRLYNSGVKAKALREAFGISHSTMQRWGKALKSRDKGKLLGLMNGPGAARKMTPEIVAFVSLRFRDIYLENKYNYSQRIREEIKKVFGTTLSGETLRPHFKVLKQQLRAGAQGTQQEQGDSGCTSDAERAQRQEGDGYWSSIDRVSQEGERSKCESADKDAGKSDGEDNRQGFGHEEREQSWRDGSCLCDVDMGEEKQASDCDSSAQVVNAAAMANIALEGQGGLPALARQAEQYTGDGRDNRKYSLRNSQGEFSHHVGVLLFAPLLVHLSQRLGKEGDIVRQTMVSVLLGALNVEQTKLLNSGTLKLVLGSHTRSLNLQRQQLDRQATQETLQCLLTFNAEMVGAKRHTAFYYDPHTKHYTGARKILKGWCPKIKGVSKVLHMDFVHTIDGYPIYFEHADNYYDMRQRFPTTAQKLRSLLGIPEQQDLTFVIDRGIYKLELFRSQRDTHNHIITWEKGYKKGQWDQGQEIDSFTIERARNNSTDLKKYTFGYMERPWHRDPCIRQIIVLATNPKGKTIQVSILATDPNRSAESIIALIFGRWIQENDFKYLDTHFGINEITSYAVLTYEKLKSAIEDRQIKSGEYKALELEKQQLTNRLGKLLAQVHLATTARQTDSEKILEITLQINQVKAQMANTQSEVSRLETLIDRNFQRLDTHRKALVDAIKITARNIFYQTFEPFRQRYDNYRDDHVIFRNLTQAGGYISFQHQQVVLTLYPTMCHQPHLRRVIEDFLQQLNAIEPPMPDGSARVLRFRLA